MELVTLSKGSVFPPPCALFENNSSASLLRSDSNENPSCRSDKEAGGLVADVLKIGDWDVNSCEGARAVGFMCGRTGFIFGDVGAGRAKVASGGWADHASEGDRSRILVSSFCFPLPSDFWPLSVAKAPCVFSPQVAIVPAVPHASPPLCFPSVLLSSSFPNKEPHAALVAVPQVCAVVPHPSLELAPQVAAPEPP